MLSRFRGGPQSDGDARPHFVVCGSDALVYTLAEELATTAQRIRLTVIAPRSQRPDVPDLAELRGIRLIRSDRLDEPTFRAAGLEGAAALALIMPDDVINLHAALCAQSVEPDLRLVIRMFNTGLGYGVRRLFADCAVLSDAGMAVPAFVAAALGEVAPTHFRYSGRTLYVARRGDVHERDVVCSLAGLESTGRVVVLPAEPAPSAVRDSDLVLAEATGRPVGQAVAARRLVQARRRRRPMQAMGRAVRSVLRSRLGVAVFITLMVTALSGALLSHFDGVRGFWESIYVTLLTAVGASDVEVNKNAIAQAAQLLLTVAGVALLPLITAAVVEGMVNARLALSSGKSQRSHTDHIVLVGLGSVGTGVLRQLTDLGLEVVAIDRNQEARGVAVAERLGVEFIHGDAAREETLREASIATCKALVVVSTDDITNLQAALNARAVRPDLRVVLRLFDDDFARRVQMAFNINVSRSVSRLAAPAFAAAMLERDVIVTIPVERHALLVAEVRVLAGSYLAGEPLRRADRPFSTRVIGLTAPGSQRLDWAPDLEQRLVPGDKILVVARRAGLRALAEQAAPPVILPEGETA